MSGMEEWRKMRPACIPYRKPIEADEVASWFADALDHDDSKPPAEVCMRLATQFYELSAPRVAEDIRYELESRCGDAAKELFKAICDLEEFVCDEGVRPYSELLGYLPRIMVGGRDRNRPGRKKEKWHAAAKCFAPLIVEALRDIGCKKLSAKSGDSPVAIVGAHAVKRAFDLPDLEPAGFSSALMPRNRGKKAPNPLSQLPPLLA